jgi:hypothetical protein
LAVTCPMARKSTIKATKFVPVKNWTAYMTGEVMRQKMWTNSAQLDRRRLASERMKNSTSVARRNNFAQCEGNYLQIKTIHHYHSPNRENVDGDIVPLSYERIFIRIHRNPIHRSDDNSIVISVHSYANTNMTNQI